MKIALFCGYLKTRGGAERAILEYLKHTRHQVDIYTLRYEPEKTYPEFADYNVTVLSNPLFKKLCSLLPVKWEPLLVQVPFSSIPNSYDKYLIMSGGILELISFNLPKDKTVLYCFSPYRRFLGDEMAFNRRYSPNFVLDAALLFIVPVFNFFEKRAFRRIPVKIFTSDFILHRVQAKGLLSGETHVVVPGVNLPPLPAPSPRRDKYFIYLSRFSAMKRQHTVLQAWSSFSALHPEYRLVLAGDNFSKKYYDSLPRLPNVIFRSNLADAELKDLYANCSAGIFVAFKEDFGIAPFEVISYNKTLIAVKEGGFYEFVRNVPSALFVEDDANLVSSLSKAFNDFAENESSYLEKAKSNRAYLDSLGLTWERYAKGIDDVLDSV